MRGLVITTLLIVAVTAAAGAVARPREITPRCFGAAARDPTHPCRNPRLRRLVRPSPSLATITPNAPCTPSARIGLVQLCAFGVAAADATATVALVGDSHATHWRAALEVVAQREHWRGLSITRTACPYSRAVKRTVEPRRSQCVEWVREVPRWFAEHPEIDTVFVAELTSMKGVVGADRAHAFSASVRGYRAAWRRLPPSVRHIMVIRDTPRSTDGTLACVSRAMRRHEPAGETCAIPRAGAVLRDPAAVAAEQLHSPRVRTVRFTRQICSRRLCFPVVGGALVYKDRHHLTRVFATTLGPLLDRRFRALRRSWTRAAVVRCPAGRCG
jgi:hypothetical protein